MKKADILNLIKLKDEYNKNLDIQKIKAHDFPKIELLKEEIEILKKEILTRRTLLSNQYNELSEMQKNCDHSIRYYYPNVFSMERNCIICGKRILDDNMSNGSLYNDINRNRYFCEFLQSFEDDEEGHIEGVNIEVIYSYIKEILRNKPADEEIDLVKEMKKINPENCRYIENPFKKEYYVLVIGGSNKLMLNNNCFISSLNTDIATEISKYFVGIPRVNLELIDNDERYSSFRFNELFPNKNISGVKFESYKTLEDLNKILNELSNNCPFDLVIDLSNPFEVNIYNNEMNIKKIYLDLKKLFPKSFLVKFHSLFEKLLEKYDLCIGYNNEEYSILFNNGTCKEIKNLTAVCTDIRKLALKK